MKKGQAEAQQLMLITEFILGIVVVMTLMYSAYGFANNDQFVKQYIAKDVAMMMDTVMAVQGDLEINIPLEKTRKIEIGKSKEFNYYRVLVDDDGNSEAVFAGDEKLFVGNTILEADVVKIIKESDNVKIVGGSMSELGVKEVGEIKTGEYSDDLPITVFTVSLDREKGIEQLRNVARNHRRTQSFKVDEDEFITALYDLGVRYGIDPGFALGVSEIESGMGKDNVPLVTKCNNLFGIKGGNCVSGFRGYKSVSESVEGFYKLVKESYLSKGQNTVDKFSAPLAYASRETCGSTPNREGYYCCKINHCYCCHKSFEETPWVKTVLTIRRKVAES